MSSRYAAARPKRDAESFARVHHGERPDDQDGPSSSKRVKFDVRNPSALAPDANDYDDEDDAVLEADVIGKASAGATKRGAVNIDGYDSDSENETFNDRAEARRGKKGKGADGEADVDIADKLDNYDKNLRDGGGVAEKDGNGEDEDEDEDMFAADDDDPDEDETNDPAAPKTTSQARDKKAKEVRFLDDNQIEGQEKASRSGGHIHLDEGDASSDDEEDVVLAIQEEDLDEEVGLGGLKRNAPKIDAFNMKTEQEEGAFDESGNFIRKAVDPDAVHDRWLEGLSKKDMKKARDAHEKREAEMRRQRKEDDSILTQDLLRPLILNLDKGETPIEALARLGKVKKQEKKIPKWKLKKQKKQNNDGGDAMDVDHAKDPEDPEQVRIKDAINAITDAADKLLGREYAEIYETEREKLIREWQSEAGEPWREPTPPPAAGAAEEAPAEVKSALGTRLWEYRWTDGRDDESIQGPYDGTTMKAWQDAGYFEGVEFRAVGDEIWSRVADFV